MKKANLDKIEPGDSAAVEDLPMVGGDLLQLQHLHKNVRSSLEYRWNIGVKRD
jgi:hypothetical protein